MIILRQVEFTGQEISSLQRSNEYLKRQNQSLERALDLADGRITAKRRMNKHLESVINEQDRVLRDTKYKLGLTGDKLNRETVRRIRQNRTLAVAGLAGAAVAGTAGYLIGRKKKKNNSQENK